MKILKFLTLKARSVFQSQQRVKILKIDIGQKCSKCHATVKLDILEGKVKGEVKNEPLGKLRIVEISRIGSNPKATMLRDESVLRIAIVYHEKD